MQRPVTPSAIGARVLVFDVLGTLLDEDAGQLRGVQREPALRPVAAEGFVARWSARFHERMRSIQEGLAARRAVTIPAANSTTVQGMTATEYPGPPRTSTFRPTPVYAVVDPPQTSKEVTT